MTIDILSLNSFNTMLLYSTLTGTDPAARQKDAVILCITVLSKRRPLFKHLLNKLSYIQVFFLFLIVGLSFFLKHHLILQSDLYSINSALTHRTH